MNVSVFEALFSLTGQSAVVDALVVFFARYLPYFLVGSAFVFFFSGSWWRRNAFVFIEVALALIVGTGLVARLVQFFHPVLRPFEVLSIEPLIMASGSSFPSAHAAFFFALAVALVYYHRRWGAVYLVAAALVGVARVAAGIHWPLDIVGGAAVGVLSAIGVHYLLWPHLRALYRDPGALE